MIGIREGGLGLGFLTIRPSDVLDVLAVSFITYKLFSLIRGTRAVPMFIGVFLIVIMSVMAEYLHLDGLNYLVSQSKPVFLVGFLILFQPELRRVLARVGENRFLARYLAIRAPNARDAVVEASLRLSDLSLGALIVLEREVGFRAIVESGISLSATVSVDLLTTIFTPNTPLHDGAVVIRGDQIVAAGCILPLTQGAMPDNSLGTRHRAALGLSEETDAAVIIVSEENRRISLATRGEIELGLSPAQLRGRLAEYFERDWKVAEVPDVP